MYLYMCTYKHRFKHVYVYTCKHMHLCVHTHSRLPLWLSNKESACSAGDAGSIPR